MCYNLKKEEREMKSYEIITAGCAEVGISVESVLFASNPSDENSFQSFLIHLEKACDSGELRLVGLRPGFSLEEITSDKAITPETDEEKIRAVRENIERYIDENFVPGFIGKFSRGDMIQLLEASDTIKRLTRANRHDDFELLRGVHISPEKVIRIWNRQNPDADPIRMILDPDGL